MQAAQDVDSRNDEVGRFADAERYLIMWGGKNWAGDGHQLSTLGVDTHPLRLQFNLARSAIGTLKAHQATMTPVTRFLTNEADWKLQRDAKQGEALVQGEFERNDLYTQTKLAYVDAATTGTACVKVGGSGGLVNIERILACFELLVDPYEARSNSKPLTLYHVRPVDREVLLANTSGSTKQDIAMAPNAPMGFCGVGYDKSRFDRTTDQVVRIDAYRLPLGKEKGQHIACVAPDILLGRRPWVRDEFPFVFWHWEQSQRGFWGRGLCEQLVDHQRGLNLLDQRIGMMIRKVSQTRVYVSQKGRARDRLTDMPYKVIPVATVGEDRVVVESNNVVPTELWEMRESKRREALEEVGVNSQAAFAEKSPGIVSGVAIREENQLFNRRALDKAQGFEKFHSDTGKMTLAERVEMAKRGDDAKVKAKRTVAGRRRFFEVSWKDSKLDPDRVDVAVYPASSKPDTPAGRAQIVDEWRQQGALTAQQAMVLTASPDTDEHIETQLAPYNLVLGRIELMLEDGAEAYHFPEPEHDLALIVELTTLALNRFELMGAPDDRLELLRRYISDAKWLLDQGTAAAQPVAQATAESEEQILAAQAGAALNGTGAPLPQ